MYTFYFHTVKNKEPRKFKLVAAKVKWLYLPLGNEYDLQDLQNLSLAYRVIVDPDFIWEDDGSAKLQLAPGYKAKYPEPIFAVSGSVEPTWSKPQIPCGEDITSNVIVESLIGGADSAKEDEFVDTSAYDEYTKENAKPETRPDPYLECPCIICTESREQGPKIGPLPPQAPLAPSNTKLQCTCGDIYAGFPAGHPEKNQLDSTCPVHGNTAVLEPPVGTMLMPQNSSYTFATPYPPISVTTTGPIISGTFTISNSALAKKGFWARILDKWNKYVESNSKKS